MFPENHVLLMIAAGCVDSLAPPRCLNASYYKQILLHPPLQVSQPAPVTATLPYHHQLLWNALIIGCNQPKGKDGGGADKWSSHPPYLSLKWYGATAQERHPSTHHETHNTQQFTTNSISICGGMLTNSCIHNILNSTARPTCKLLLFCSLYLKHFCFSKVQYYRTIRS